MKSDDMTRKEKPVHYIRAMRDAHREGRKLMTRRVVPPKWLPTITVVLEVQGECVLGRDSFVTPPLGKPCDFVYIHEPIEFVDIKGMSAVIRYIDDGEHGDPHVIHIPKRVKYPKLGRWEERTIPSEWARDWAEITSVRVECLQNISSKDAIDEGIMVNQGWCREWYRGLPGSPLWENPVTAFRDLWDSINGKRGHGWEMNDPVFVYGFGPIAENDLIYCGADGWDRF